MSGVILIAGMAKKPYLKAGYDVIGVDHGAFVCLQHGVNMSVAIGDFDSVSTEEYEKLSKNCELLKLAAHKNESDTEVAISYALKHGYDSIIVYGGLGGRLDHEMANINLMMHRNLPIILMDDHNRMQVLQEGSYQIKKEYTYLSFLPIEDSCISEEGVAYPLDHQQLNKQDIYGISNEIIDTSATITIHNGKMLMIESND